MLLVGAIAGYLYGVNSSPAATTAAVTTTTTFETTVSTVPHTYDQVASAYANHLINLEAINPGDFLSGYESNATVEWKGYSGGCDGNYTGIGEIATLMEALVANDSYLFVSNETQTITMEGNHWVVNSTFDFTGNSTADKSIASPFVGFFSGTIAALDSFVNPGNASATNPAILGPYTYPVLIASETWNFIHFDDSVLERPYAATCGP